MNENVKELTENAETEPMTGEDKFADQLQKKPKKGFLKTVKDAATKVYATVHSNPVGRVACRIVKAGAVVLAVKGAYDKGFKKGQENPVVVTITPIEEGNPEEAPAESETNAEANVPAEEPEKEELN